MNTLASSIDFKGFNIMQSDVDGNLRVYASRLDTVPMLNMDGYATVAGAKGAITKYVNAGAEPIKNQAEEMRDNCPARAAVLDNAVASLLAQTEVIIVPAPVKAAVAVVKPFKVAISRNKREGGYAGKAIDYDENPKNPKHWRQGGSRYKFSSLKGTAAFYKMLNA